MTKQEVSTRYGIPENILDEYHSMELCDAVRIAMNDWKYTDEDLERLSMIMALHDIGFAKEEVEIYMRLLITGASTEKERMKMLDEHRKKALDEIHLKERQLDRMDYLRHEIRENQKKR
ncbi:MAG: MerR family transcriptional regulator [Lachnospiraceae bacterium]|nr:MerR family transcriptional regulator [Lachnospiraceae bacterium]